MKNKAPLTPLPAIEGGAYRNWKGDLYWVLCVARCSETLDAKVIYMEDGGTDIWDRPYSMWHELVVNKDGETVPRYHKVDDDLFPAQDSFHVYGMNGDVLA